jgi:hypothetical protein
VSRERRAAASWSNPVAAVCLAFVAFGGGSACGSRGPAAADLKASAGPHLPSFVAFDPWARRAALGDPAFRDDRAFREAAFAPLREQPAVGNAWIARRGTQPRTLAMRDESPTWPEARFVPQRHPELGAIEVALSALPPRGPVGTSGPERPVALVSHEGAIEDGAVVRVVVAYLLEAP